MTSERLTYKIALLCLFLCVLHCSNGVLISKSNTIRHKRQTGSDGCLLPAHPSNGRYTLGNGTSYVPRTPVSSSSTITLNCNPGYQKKGVEQLFCVSGNWLGGNLSEQRCKLECGVKGTTRLRRLVGGTTPEAGEYPWVAAVYDKDLLICGGSIISSRFILSAAHCFTTTDGFSRNVSSYQIAAGKHFSAVGDQRDKPREQLRKVEKIYVNDNYRGMRQNYANDIAIVEVVEEFQWSNYVLPVCVDLADEGDLVEGNLGVVGAWGHTKGDGVPAEALQTLEIPYQSQSKCKDQLDSGFFAIYYTADKFCAGYANQQKSICRGDGGSGFYMNQSGRYFIRGVVSLAPISSTGNIGCDTNSFGLYTQVSKFGHWIQETTNRVIDGCLLPEHPENGKFSIVGASKSYNPDTTVKTTTAITLSCDPGYLRQGNEKLYCISQSWVGGDLSDQQCLKLCPPINDVSVKAACRKNYVAVDCNEAVEGTQAIVRCAPFFKDTLPRRPIMTCRGGVWTPVLGGCIPECGLQHDNANTVVIGGTPAVAGDHPWTIAIYNRSNIQICGGSIISRRYVLSAAHCFANEDGEVSAASSFTIAAGKHYQGLDDPKDMSRKQIRKITNLYVHEDYQGRWQNFANDIAIARVDQDFVLSVYVQPVCLDAVDDVDFIEGNKGVVNGWGYTEEVGVPSDELMTLALPYHTKDICKEHLPKDFFRRFYTQDKFCAGNVDKGTNVCSGDSGSGFYMNSTGNFFVRGVVSVVYSTLATVCDSNKFGLYTKVSKFDDWIYRITEGYV